MQDKNDREQAKRGERNRHNHTLEEDLLAGRRNDKVCCYALGGDFKVCVKMRRSASFITLGVLRLRSSRRCGESDIRKGTAQDKKRGEGAPETRVKGRHPKPSLSLSLSLLSEENKSFFLLAPDAKDDGIFLQDMKKKLGEQTTKVL